MYSRFDKISCNLDIDDTLIRHDSEPYKRIDSIVDRRIRRYAVVNYVVECHTGCSFANDCFVYDSVVHIFITTS